MFLQNVANGFRALRPMAGKLVFVALMLIVPVAYTTVQRFMAAKKPDSIYGDRMGIVRVSVQTHDGGLRQSTQDLGAAVIRIQYSPDYFSFLDRYKAGGIIVDSFGNRRKIDPSQGRNDWSIAWNSQDCGRLNQHQEGKDPLFCGLAASSLAGTWNVQYVPFQLTFSYMNNREQLGPSTTLIIDGNLEAGDQTRFDNLISQISAK